MKWCGGAQASLTFAQTFDNILFAEQIYSLGVQSKDVKKVYHKAEV